MFVRWLGDPFIRITTSVQGVDMKVTRCSTGEESFCSGRRSEVAVATLRKSILVGVSG